MLEAKFVSVKRFEDERGILSPLEGYNLPFKIERCFWITDVPNGQVRGNHAHYESVQCAICLAGSCKIHLDDGTDRLEVYLSRKTGGLVIEPFMWHKMYDFSKDCVLLVLASNEYDETDYIKDYEEFKKLYGQ